MLSKQQKSILTTLTAYAYISSEAPFSITLRKQTKGNISSTWYILEGQRCRGSDNQREPFIIEPYFGGHTATLKVIENRVANPSNHICLPIPDMELFQLIGQVIVGCFTYPNKKYQRGLFADRFLKRDGEGAAIIFTFIPKDSLWRICTEEDERGSLDIIADNFSEGV